MPATRSFDKVAPVLLSSITAVPARLNELLIVSKPAPSTPGASVPPFRTVAGPSSSPVPVKVAPLCTVTLPVFNWPSTSRAPAATVVVPE